VTGTTDRHSARPVRHLLRAIRHAPSATGCWPAGTRRWFAFAALAALLAPAVGAPPTEEQIARIRAAAPDHAAVRPQQPRRLLVFTACKGFRHSAIECGAAALEIMGQKTGAYAAVVSDDVAMFRAENLRQFDAVCFNNTTGELFEDPTLRQDLLEFVKNGGGVVGIHAATDCCYQWPEFGALIGGYFDGHPWNETVTVKLDEPQHPLNAAFGGRPFEVADEIYQFREPYSRQKLRVLLSLDTTKTDMRKPGIKRRDGDFALSWVRRYGKGRVFYCALGHREEIFWNPAILRHYLDGIQFALGDLEADAAPSATLQAQPGGPAAPPAGEREAWVPLFNGKDLSGWKGLVGNPVTRATMSPAELAAAQAAADEKMRAHWTVADGVLKFDGQGDSLCTAADYGDFELRLDWRIGPDGDSGIYLRGVPQVQIWDAGPHPEGSGGLYNNQSHPSKPMQRADNPVGQWNSFRIRMLGDRVTVHLNETLVVDDVPLENYWERGRPLPDRGPIELQAHHTPLEFRNILIRELPADARPKGPTWRPLFNGQDLSGWQCQPGSWKVERGELVCAGGGDVWTAEQFGDFALEAEFKLPAQGNSGIFLRTADPADPVQTGIELQLCDSYGRQPPGREDCGAIFDCLAPRVQAVRPADEWNHVVVYCRGPRISACLNGQPIIDMNLDEWVEPHRNPDGSPNKFNTAYKDMPRAGHIGFQDHGHPVRFRNVRIKPLTE